MVRAFFQSGRPEKQKCTNKRVSIPSGEVCKSGWGTAGGAAAEGIQGLPHKGTQKNLQKGLMIRLARLSQKPASMLK